MKPATVSIVSPSICHEVMGPDAMILVFCHSLDVHKCIADTLTSEPPGKPILINTCVYIHIHTCVIRGQSIHTCIHVYIHIHTHSFSDSFPI